MHYVHQMVEDALRDLSDQDIAFFHHFKRDLERGEYILNSGTPASVSALDLLWQDYRRYDHIGHARLAWMLWIGVVGHPRIKSAAFRVGARPGPDKAVDFNNEALHKATAPFKANFTGGYGYQDGLIFPDKTCGFKNDAIPLQVGSVCPAQLIWNLRRCKSFARWPYGSEFIYAFEFPWDGGVFNIIKCLQEHWELCPECAKHAAASDSTSRSS